MFRVRDLVNCCCCCYVFSAIFVSSSFCLFRLLRVFSCLSFLASSGFESPLVLGFLLFSCFFLLFFFSCFCRVRLIAYFSLFFIFRFLVVHTSFGFRVRGYFLCCFFPSLFRIDWPRRVSSPWPFLDFFCAPRFFLLLVYSFFYFADRSFRLSISALPTKRGSPQAKKKGGGGPGEPLGSGRLGTGTAVTPK